MAKILESEEIRIANMKMNEDLDVLKKANALLECIANKGSISIREESDKREANALVISEEGFLQKLQGPLKTVQRAALRRIQMQMKKHAFDFSEEEKLVIEKACKKAD